MDDACPITLLIRQCCASGKTIFYMHACDISVSHMKKQYRLNVPKVEAITYLNEKQIGEVCKVNELTFGT